MDFKVDERCGCVAIIRTDIKPQHEWLMESDLHVLRIWHGVNVTGRIYGKNFICWHVPRYIIRRAHKLCKKYNQGEELECFGTVECQYECDIKTGNECEVMFLSQFDVGY